MSLLMQALKKAERSKQNSLLDDDAQDKPSEAFDEVLALAPQDLAPGRFPPRPVEFSLEPVDEPGLVALDVPYVPDDALEQIPALMPAEEAPHDPTPPQSRLGGAHKSAQNGPDLAPMPPHAPQARTERSELTLQDVPQELVPGLMPAEPFTPHASLSKDVAPALQSEPIAPAIPAGATAAAVPTEARSGNRRLGSGQRATDMPDAGAATASVTPEQGRSQSGQAISAGTGENDSGGTAGRGVAGGGAVASDSPAKPGAAARARARATAEARAAAAEDKMGWDPARIRLAVLSGVLLLIVALFGYLYWRATSAPGPGANLPMVPMPPPDAGGAKQGVIVAAPPGSPAAPDSGAAASGAGAGGMAASLAAGTGADTATAAGHVPAYGSAAGDDGPAGAHAAGTPATGAGTSAARGLVQGAQSAPAAGGNTVMATPEEIERAMQMQGGLQGMQSPPPGAATAAGGGPPPARRSEPAWSSSDIKVSHSTAAPRISPALESGYQSLLAGDLPAAADHYGSALRQDPNNRDALLGNAAVAVRRNDVAQASASYMRLLELNPSDPDALAGLLSLRPGDTGQSELRLKDLLRKSPDSAPLQFALGNLYSRQSRWTEAQQAFFRAYTASPDNPDYAFNLAVGLDRLNQPRLAFNYYQRALSLAQAGPAGFDSEAARARMRQLAEPH